MTDSLTIGIIGDGFMQPGFFETALREKLPGRELTIRSMEIDWPLRLKSTKYDPTLPVGEFVGGPRTISTSSPISTSSSLTWRRSPQQASTTPRGSRPSPCRAAGR